MINSYQPVPIKDPFSKGKRAVCAGSENPFSKVECKQLILAASGADAIYITLQLLERSGPVIVSAYTCSRVVGAILGAGYFPKFIDVDPNSGQLDDELLRRAIKQPCAAVIVTNLFRPTKNLDRIVRLSREYGVPVIEDSALVITEKIAMEPFAPDVSIYSFGRGKPLSLGGGGLGVLRSKELQLKATNCQVPNGSAMLNVPKLLIGRIRDSKQALYLSTLMHRIFPAVRPPISARKNGVLFDVNFVSQSAHNFLANSVFSWSYTEAIKRNRLAQSMYSSALLSDEEFSHYEKTIPEYTTVAFPIRIQSRDKILVILRKSGINCPVYWQYVAADLIGREKMPGAATLARELLFLPLNSSCNDKDIKKVADLIRTQNWSLF